MTHQDITVRPDSKLYSALFNRGGDKLIGAYAILKASRNGEIKYYAYKSKNNKTVSGYALLRAKTCLSLHAIQKYAPILIDMGLLVLEKNGDVSLLGNRKINKKFGSRKLVPIKLGKNLVETADNSFYVRLHAAESQQNRMIQKKRHRSEIIKQASDPRTFSELKEGRKVFKRYGDEEIIDKVVLSNHKFSEFKHGENSAPKDLKSNGTYWKAKMKSKGLIESKRRFEKQRRMRYDEFLQLKRFNMLNRNYTYCDGYLVKELVASLKCTMDKVKKETTAEVLDSPKPIKKVEMRPLSYLQFDFCAFMANEL